MRLHAQSNFLARADCSEMRLPIGARRAPSEGYRDSGLVQSPFRDALIASRHHPGLLRCAGQLREIIGDRVPGRLAGHVDVKFWLDAGIVIQRAQRQAIIVRMIVELAQDRGSAYPAKTPVISR